VNAVVSALVAVALSGTAPHGGVFRAPVRAEGGLVPAQRDVLEADLDRQIEGAQFDLVRPDDPSACIDVGCWTTVATDGGHDYLLALAVDAREADQRLSATVTDLRSGDVVVELERVCELCGRSELGDASADLVSNILRKLRAHASVVTSLSLDSVPAGASVRIDGEDVGVTPLDLQIEPGRHEVEVSAPGYENQTQDVTVQRGAAEHLRLRLAANNMAADTVPTSATPPRARVITGAALVAGGLAGLATGATLLAIHGRPIESDCSGDNVDADGDCHYLHDTRTGGVVGVVAGSAALVAGAVVLGLTLRKRERSVSVHPTGSGLLVRGRF